LTKNEKKNGAIEMINVTILPTKELYELATRIENEKKLRKLNASHPQELRHLNIVSVTVDGPRTKVTLSFDRARTSVLVEDQSVMDYRLIAIGEFLYKCKKGEIPKVENVQYLYTLLSELHLDSSLLVRLCGWLLLCPPGDPFVKTLHAVSQWGLEERDKKMSPSTTRTMPVTE
jgi:hypothetical protein